MIHKEVVAGRIKFLFAPEPESFFEIERIAGEHDSVVVLRKGGEAREIGFTSYGYFVRHFFSSLVVELIVFTHCYKNGAPNGAANSMHPRLLSELF